MRKYFTPLLVIALFAALLTATIGCNREWLPPTLYKDSTLVAGSDSAGYVNGAGCVARFYVPDENNNQIRGITPSGAVTIFAAKNLKIAIERNK